MAIKIKIPNNASNGKKWRGLPRDPVIRAALLVFLVVTIGLGGVFYHCDPILVTNRNNFFDTANHSESMHRNARSKTSTGCLVERLTVTPDCVLCEKLF